MVVESRPGAGSEIGTEYVSRAAADGNTLLIMSPSFVVLPHVRKLNYDPLTVFVPICELATFPPLIVVNGDSPYHTLNDFIDAARARPSALTYATVGPDTASQVASPLNQRRRIKRRPTGQSKESYILLGRATHWDTHLRTAAGTTRLPHQRDLRS
jgi:tripartite-type tricarboxylate transporter receptor subunit TctC